MAVGGLCALNRMRNPRVWSLQSTGVGVGSAIVIMLLFAACPPVHEGGTSSRLAGPEKL